MLWCIRPVLRQTGFGVITFEYHKSKALPLLIINQLPVGKLKYFSVHAIAAAQPENYRRKYQA
jgi:hypothetical protein